MNLQLLGRIIITLEVIILVGVTLHAPFTVWLGTLLPAYDELIKSWKEILMGVCLLLVIVYISYRHVWHELWRDWIIRLAALYALLHVMLLPWMWQGIPAALAGLLIDLRYVLFFVLIYVSARYIASTRRALIGGAIVGALVVIGFAIMQLTFLPDDILAHIGYSRQTIAPYLTVDLNHEYVRINSTLRGPNPLGAYAGMCLALALAFITQRRHRLTRREGVITGTLAVGSMAALWASYSRSAVVAGALMAVIVAGLSRVKRVSRSWWIGGAIVLLGVFGGVIAARDTAFVSNVILHENPAGGSVEKSNEGHVESLHDGTVRMIRQPLGGGIGSTGSASLRGDAPLIIENQYLFVAHESGWLGLGVFATLFGMVLYKLWNRRDDWLALGVLASGVGLAVIGLLLPVWVDDTVAVIWWGLAGLALGVRKGKKRGQEHESDKKAA